MAIRRDRVALNPIQWMATDDGWLDPALSPPPRELLTRVKSAGFDAVFLDVPGGWEDDDYRRLLTEIGLAPAPGYFSLGASGGDEDGAALAARAASIARRHAAFGLTDIVVATGMSREAPRVIHPARGYQADPARLERIIPLIAKVAEAMRAEGVRAAFHPHVGTWVETEEETRAVLDAIDGALLAFAPDTGHLAWANADVRALIDEYAARVRVLHVKDCRLSVARRGKERDATYRQTVQEGLWVEPGRGELDLRAMLAPLPAEFDGWAIVEVDRPDIRDPWESARASAAWMRALTG